MAKKKYLLMQRGSVDQPEYKPSPAQMQEMYAFNAWKEQFKDSIIPGRALTSPARKHRDSRQASSSSAWNVPRMPVLCNSAFPNLE